ncbi:SulP family inorganic anion transporter [Colwellia sp. KU-HH00111]
MPLALAFGVSSGAGAIAGVYGAILVGFFAALFGGTATQISGPTGPMSVVMALVLTQMIAHNPEHGLSLAFSCVILAGLFQIAFGLLKLGKYFVMVPYPVISGFMSGIGIIIIVLQVSPLLGLSADSNPVSALTNIPDNLSYLNITAAILGGASLIIMTYWPKNLARFMPAPLFALVFLTLISALLLPDKNIPTIGEIPTGLPELIIPSFSIDALYDITYFAFLLAVLGAIDSLLTSMVADSMTQTHHLSDKELIGQGIGNSIAGLFGALPGAGATMRTAINIGAGGNSALSGITHAIALLFITLWAADYAQYVPHSVLAGMLLKVGLDIIDWRFLKKINKVGLFSACLMLLVLLLTVFVDLITAVVVGMFIANLVTIDRLTSTQLDCISFTKGTAIKCANNLVVPADKLAHTLLLSINGPISFAVSRELSRRFTENMDFSVLIIDLCQAKLIGTTTSVLIIDLVTRTQNNGKRVLVITGEHGLNQSLDKLELNSLLGPQQLFSSKEQALLSI